MRYSNRFFLYAPFVVLAGLAIVATLRWWSVADDLENRLGQANKGREIAPGVTLHFRAARIGGFPFNLDAVLDNLTVSIEATRGPFVWRAEHFALHALTYGPTQEIFEAAGMQKLSWTGAQGGARRFAFVPGSLRASAIAADGTLVRFDLDLNGIGASELWGKRLQLHLRRDSTRNAIQVLLSADELHLARPLQRGFGALIGHLLIAGRAVSEARLLPLLSGSADWRSAAEAWRLGGGSFVLDRFDLAAGIIGARGRGKLALDAHHRPEGTLELTVADPEALSPRDGTGAAFASALLRLSKGGAPRVPLHVLARLGGGRANVSATTSPAFTCAAGSLEALY